MKKVVFSLVLCFVTFCMYSQDVVYANNEETNIQEVLSPVVHWEKTFQDAITKAKTEKKPILIYFTGSDWCGPCIQLDKNLFHTDKFLSYSKDHLVVYIADFPRNTDLVSKENKKTNKQLSKKYKQESFPTMIIIDDKGNVLGRKNGTYMAEYYYPFFKDAVTKYKS